MKKNKFIDISFFILCGLIVFSSCRKDTGKLVGSITDTTIVVTEPEPAFICEDQSFDETPLPPEPPIGFDYTIGHGNKGLWRVLYDPKDKDIIYYLTLESYNSAYLWKYNRKKNTKILLDKNVLSNMSINKSGWLAYDKMDKNIYKIKTNGDSLTKLTSQGTYLYPTWDNYGQYLYFISDAVSDGVYRINSYGKIDTLKNINTIVYPINNYFYYYKNSGSDATIVRKDINTGEDQVIVSSANNLGAGFYDFYTNEENTVLYWYGDDGLLQTNLATLQTTWLVKSGRYTRTVTAHYMRSPINKRFIAILFNQTITSDTKITLSSNIVEFTEDGTCRRKVDVP